METQDATIPPYHPCISKSYIITVIHSVIELSGGGKARHFPYLPQWSCSVVAHLCFLVFLCNQADCHHPTAESTLAASFLYILLRRRTAEWQRVNPVRQLGNAVYWIHQNSGNQRNILIYWIHQCAENQKNMLYIKSMLRDHHNYPVFAASQASLV